MVRYTMMLHRPAILQALRVIVTTLLLQPLMLMPMLSCVLQKQGYVSRAAFKLIEIQKKHKVIKPGGDRQNQGIIHHNKQQQWQWHHHWAGWRATNRLLLL
jgi:hypothetical protein